VLAGDREMPGGEIGRDIDRKDGSVPLARSDAASMVWPTGTLPGGVVSVSSSLARL